MSAGLQAVVAAIRPPNSFAIFSALWTGDSHDADAARTRGRSGRDNRIVNVLGLFGLLAALFLFAFFFYNFVDLPLLGDRQKRVRNPVQNQA